MDRDCDRRDDPDTGLERARHLLIGCGCLIVVAAGCVALGWKFG